MRIGLLMCDHVSDEFRQIAGDYYEMFGSIFEDRDTRLIAYDVRNGQFPNDPAECDAFLISGSRASVYDDEQWIRRLEGFVRNLVEASVPIFGVCFGLQVMATALGGIVEKSRNGWGVGVHDMTICRARPWMGDRVSPVSLILSHQDQITQLPLRASVLGSSDHCENFLVEFTRIHVGIQGHPEFTARFAEAIYRDRREHLGELIETADTARVVDWILAVFAPT